ncbi:hypothetical protein I8748_27710 [Nostoc sp. CENA67]|uniref:Uncharacterized protein n=1 Tax=Amazonocrinis nigriterrae CENA67 TaxID=2794033 RepID=A0A8J7L9R8_9NOST|nr:hypothetical protein [Amazonocrinis nigriterrae]MBH8565909.1 hypothetical protein [Amazonocrinis nigriterrae CENA67]
MEYSQNLLSSTAHLISTIENHLNCSFDEACEIVKIIFYKANHDEIQIDNSLYLLLPDFLEQVRTQEQIS